MLNGVMLAVGLDMVSQLFVDTLAGRELSDNPAEWIMKGVDKSGVTGWLFDALNLTGKFTRGATSPETWFRESPVDRYAGQDPVSALVGPTAGLVTDITKTTGAAVTGDWSRGDVSSARRLPPFQNLFFLRWLFDKAEAGAAEEMGYRRSAAAGADCQVRIAQLSSRVTLGKNLQSLL